MQSKIGRFSKSDLRFFNVLPNVSDSLRWGPKHIATHIVSHIHIATHARFSIRYSSSTTVWRWEVNIVIKHSIHFMNT